MAEDTRSFRLTGTTEEWPRIEALLRAEGFEFEPEPFFPGAKRLLEEPFPLGRSLAARFGRIYIQDRSSMLPPLALSPGRGGRVLDMCAAPGSKTGLLSSLVGPEGAVLACEPGERMGTLRANLRKTGCINAGTVRSLAQDLPLEPQRWNHIQLDPPCSGWGTENRNPGVREQWTPERLAPLKDLQRKLLAKAADLLAPGGHLVYSTCTTNPEENEAQVVYAMQELGLEQEQFARPEGFVFAEPRKGLKGVLCVADESEGQGFFVAALRKPGKRVESAESPEKNPKGGLRLESISGGDALEYSQLPPGKAVEHDGRVFWVPSKLNGLLPDGVKWQGCRLGRIGGKGDRKKFRPDATLWGALPVSLPVDGIEAETDDLVRLLSGQGLPSGKGNGPCGLYWQGLRLGWLARKGNRLLWQEK